MLWDTVLGFNKSFKKENKYAIKQQQSHTTLWMPNEYQMFSSLKVLMYSKTQLYYF